jgi:UDP-glucose 4-epimerase
MVRVGLTGATGFIGGALLPALERAGYDVRALDDRSGAVRVEYRDRDVPRLDFASDAGLRLLSDSDVILHLAAVSGVMICAQDPVGTARVNVAGTERLYGMCRDRRIPVAFASSLAVVGAPEHLPVREGTPARPTHEYARQKATGERLTVELASAAGVPTANLRQSNVYGGYLADGRRIAKGNVLELFVQQSREGRLRVNAPGTQRRDFVHIEDVVDHWIAAVRFLTRSPRPSGSPTFQVASGEAHSVREIAERVAREFAQLHPDAPSLRVEVVPNPREGIELLEPGFQVDRSETEKVLGLACRHHLDHEIVEILRRASEPSPVEATGSRVP